jgi:phenolic acid decarboxylase
MWQTNKYYHLSVNQLITCYNSAIIKSIKKDRVDTNDFPEYIVIQFIKLFNLQPNSIPNSENMKKKKVNSIS